MLTRVVSGRFRPMRVVLRTRTYPGLRKAEEGIPLLGEVDVLDEREKTLPLNTVLSFEAPLGFIFCKM
jgi:hypothetical protein